MKRNRNNHNKKAMPHDGDHADQVDHSRRNILGVLGAGALYTFLSAYGCADPSSGSDNNKGNTQPPEQRPDPEPWNPDYNNIADLAAFYTQEADGVDQPLQDYGHIIAADPSLAAWDVQTMLDRYQGTNDADWGFRNAVMDVYETMLRLKGLTPEEASPEVDHLMACLSDGYPADLENIMMDTPQGPMNIGGVFFGYIDDNGTQKGYIALNLKDENNNDRLLVAVDNDLVLDGTGNITNITELVDYVKANYSIQQQGVNDNHGGEGYER
ncbi:hypothetical protein GF345_05415 [Candidatus Woesearchaeota archaeon]|nr:hypothetical protein [Candidatus Woesearchaeota archaeon]